MPTRFGTVGLIGKYADAQVASTLGEVSDYLQKRGIRVVVDEGSSELLSDQNLADQSLERVSRAELAQRSQLAIVVGGDGTLLNAARALAAYDVPLLGINLGRLGFLTDISPQAMVTTLDEILEGDYVEEQRFLLHAQIQREGEVISAADALNDVVVHKWNVARMIELRTYVDGLMVNDERADGVIVSTPTGSTAYAMSAGGPIVHPTLNALVLAPICPHTLSNRPIVVSGDSQVEIVVCKHVHEAQMTCDGQIGMGLLGGDCVKIHKKERTVRLIHPAAHDYFALLRAKLHWGKQP
jgi:NAD+ kinase